MRYRGKLDVLLSQRPHSLYRTALLASKSASNGKLGLNLRERLELTFLLSSSLSYNLENRPSCRIRGKSGSHSRVYDDGAESSEKQTLEIRPIDVE